MKDLDAATDAKTAIEDAQREDTKAREERGETFVPRFFELRAGEYRPAFALVLFFLFVFVSGGDGS